MFVGVPEGFYFLGDAFFLRGDIFVWIGLRVDDLRCDLLDSLPCPPTLHDRDGFQQDAFRSDARFENPGQFGQSPSRRSWNISKGSCSEFLADERLRSPFQLARSQP
jgi:hypothetical protein